jgi:putative oxidoreductase
MKKLESYAAPSYALLRIMTGWMFAFHGAQKILHVYVPAQMPPINFGSQMWIGGIIELVGGVLVTLGLLTRWAAFLCSGMMAVAYFQFHWRFQWGGNFWPGVNQGETAVLYCFVFLYIACRGAGIWSLDKDRN